MPCWYFSKQELLNTPSIRDGIDTDIEARYRREGARFLMDCGNTMGLRYDTMATGVVFFHRFFMYHSFNEFPRYVMATCCLFLAGKVEETPKKCKDIIKAAKTYLESKNMKKHSDSFGEDPIKEIMTYEKILLQTIKFDLQVDHPYGYLLKYAKSLKGDQEQIRSMVQMAWAFINDSYCTTLCLQWEPEIIAIALMYLTSKLSKFEITDWIDKKKDSTDSKQNWWDQFVEELSLDILEDICHQILDLYATQQQQMQNKTQTNSQTPNKQNANSNGVNNGQNNLNNSSQNGVNNMNNKRKSPPDTLSLTPNSTLSSVGYNEPASPTSAKLMKTYNEPSHYPQQPQNHPHHFYSQSEQQSYHHHPPPPPPPPTQHHSYMPPTMSSYPGSQPPPPPSYHNPYNYYSSMMPSQYPPMPNNIYPPPPPPPAPNKPHTNSYSSNMDYYHSSTNTYGQSHINVNTNNSKQQYSTSSTTVSAQNRSSALKTVNITDRPI